METTLAPIVVEILPIFLREIATDSGNSPDSYRDEKAQAIRS